MTPPVTRSNAVRAGLLGIGLAACGPGTPVPDAPSVVTLAEDTSDPVNISVLLDEDGDESDYEVAITTLPEHGELDGSAGPAPLELNYTPDADFFGTDLLEFVVRPKRGKGEAVGAVVFVVEPTPDLPIAVDDAVATSELTPIDIDVVANDVDPDDEVLLLTLVGTPPSGTAEIIGAGTIRYTPVLGAVGPQAFDYSVADPSGRASSATVTVNVSAEAPVAIGSFDASPPYPNVGDPVTLAWTSVGATSCVLEPGGATVPTSGNTVFTPAGATTARLTCAGPGGPAVASVVVVPWAEDADHDGINDLLELDLGLDPYDADTDADGLADGVEVATDPLDPDSDDDGWKDGEEDLDRDGLVGPAELDPAAPDSDGDGVCDGPRVDDDGDGVGPADGCAAPDVWHVQAGGVGNGTSWASPMGLAAALAAAADGDHVWVSGGMPPSGVAFALESDVHLVGGFAGDETSVAQRRGARARLSGTGGVSSVLLATAVDVTIAGFEIDGYGSFGVKLDDSHGRLFDLLVRDGGGDIYSDGLYVAGFEDVVLARSEFRGLAGGAISGVAGSLVLADIRAESAAPSVVLDTPVDVMRSEWSGGGLSLVGTDARVSDALFRGAGLSVGSDVDHPEADLVAVDVTFAGAQGPFALAIGDRTEAWVTGATFDGNGGQAVDVCEGTVAVRNAVFWNNGGTEDVDVTCASGTATVTGSASGRSLGAGNATLAVDPFVRLASGGVLLDPEGDAADLGSVASADEAARGYPAVGLDWRVRSATADLALDVAPVDAGAHVDPLAAVIDALDDTSGTVTWRVRNARRCVLEGAAGVVVLVLDDPAAGSLAPPAADAVVGMRCEGAAGARPIWAALP